MRSSADPVGVHLEPGGDLDPDIRIRRGRVCDLREQLAQVNRLPLDGYRLGVQP